MLVVAGEHSGDEHAGRMVAEVVRLRPRVSVAALGGPRLQAAGAELVHDLVSSSVVGLVEVLANYRYFRTLFDATVEWIATHRPRVVCLVDYPGFNLRLARALRERGLSARGGGAIRVVQYISPQIWAWKAGRRFTMARDLDALAAIFPFEVGSYADTSLPVTFVGHPFVAPDYVAPVRYDARAPVLLLPGSRRQAVERIFPVLLEGLRASGRDRAVVLYPSEDILEVLRAAGVPPGVELRGVGGLGVCKTDALQDSDQSVGASAVLTSSGTMSMHCALAGIPGAIVYRANPVTYFVGRRLVKIPYLGIANLLLAGRESDGTKRADRRVGDPCFAEGFAGQSNARHPMYPEYIQGDATPANLAAELEDCLKGPARRERVVEDARRLRGLLSVQAGMSPGAWLMGNCP